MCCRGHLPTPPEAMAPVMGAQHPCPGHVDRDKRTPFPVGTEWRQGHLCRAGKGSYPSIRIRQMCTSKTGELQLSGAETEAAKLRDLPSQWLCRKGQLTQGGEGTEDDKGGAQRAGGLTELCC